MIVVKAYDAAGNRSIREIAVYYDAPVVPLPTKSPWEKPPVDTTGFTANQKFGTSTADPPSDVFFGTGKPGSEVKAYVKEFQFTWNPPDPEPSPSV